MRNSTGELMHIATPKSLKQDDSLIVQSIRQPAVMPSAWTQGSQH